MKLPAYLLLGTMLAGPTAVQTRSPGPWRVEYRWERVNRTALWGENEMWHGNIYANLLNIGDRYLPTEAWAAAEQQAPDSKNEQQRLIRNWQVGDTVSPQRTDIRQKRTYSTLANLGAIGWKVPPPVDTNTIGRQVYRKSDFWDAPNDTSTVVRMRLVALPVAWNVDPATVTLLRNCKNPMVAPPVSKGIRFVATGATLGTDAKEQQLLLVPIGPVVTLRAYRGKQQLFAHTFEVADAPPPIVKVFCHRPSDDKREYPPFKPRFTLTFRAISTHDFAEIMPEDARYRVARTTISLWRRKQLLQTTTINGPQADLSDWHSVSQLNDSLRVEEILIQRQNFQKVVESKSLQQTFRLPCREE